MKRILVLFMTALLLLGLTACGQANGGTEPASGEPGSETSAAAQTVSDAPAEEAAQAAADETEMPVISTTAVTKAEPKVDEQEAAIGGGWTQASSPVVPEKVRALLDQANDAFNGASFSPVALLESQVVAGTNYRILCTMQPAGAAEAQTYAIVDLYADLQGNAEITDVRKSDVETSWLGLAGGWFPVESPEITPELAAAFDKASQTAAVQVTPAAVLSQQVVAGMNYLLLARDAMSEYVFVKMYVDLQGNAEITDVTSFR